METDSYTGKSWFKTGKNTKVILDEISAQAQKRKAAFNGTTKLVLEWLLMKLAEDPSQDILELSVSEYMEARGLKDRKAAADQLWSAAGTCCGLRVEWTGPAPTIDPKTGKRGKKSAVLERGTPIGVEYWRDPSAPRVVCFRFNPHFMEWVQLWDVMEMPEGVLKLNKRQNPNSHPLCRKLCAHRHMNKGKANEHKISAARLLDCLETYQAAEDATKTDRHSAARNIERLERDLDALTNACGLIWHWCKSGGEPIPDEELQAAKPQDYEKNYLIWFSFENETKKQTNAPRKPKRKKTDTAQPAQSA